MYVQWSPLFEIGVPALDDQHRQLAELSDDLFAFLRGWLLDHILGEDRKLAGFLGDREARSGPPEAR